MTKESQPQTCPHFSPEEFPGSEKRHGPEKKKPRLLREKAEEKLREIITALRETELETEPLGLKEAAVFLVKVSGRTDNYPSYGTLEKLIRIAVLLGDFPLPPRAVRVTPGDRWKFSLSKKDLETTLEETLAILKRDNLSLEETYLRAKEKFLEQRGKRLPMENLLPEIYQQLECNTKQKRRARNVLAESMQQNFLPAGLDIQPQEVLVLGVPLEKRKDFILFWSEFIRKEGEEPSDGYALHHWPALIKVLEEQLEGVKINNFFVSQAASWLRSEEITLRAIKRRRKCTAFNYRVSPKAEEQLKLFLADFNNQERLKSILEQGFNLQEIIASRAFFPPDFNLSVTELYYLATGTKRVPRKRQIAQLVETLEKNHIPVIAREARPGVVIHGVPLAEIERAIQTIEESPLKPEQNLTPSTLYRKGYSLSITSILRQAGFERVPARKIRDVYGLLKGEIEIYSFARKRVKYPLIIHYILKKDQEYALAVVKEHWLEIDSLLKGSSRAAETADKAEEPATGLP